VGGPYARQGTMGSQLRAVTSELGLIKVSNANIRAATTVTTSLPSWNRSMLTEIDLCRAFLSQNIEDGSARAGDEGRHRLGDAQGAEAAPEALRTGNRGARGGVEARPFFSQASGPPPGCVGARLGGLGSVLGRASADRLLPRRRPRVVGWGGAPIRGRDGTRSTDRNARWPRRWA
jgi:hypothetical protein